MSGEILDSLEELTDQVRRLERAVIYIALVHSFGRRGGEVARNQFPALAHSLDELVHEHLGVPMPADARPR